ncbi:MAG: DUF429 domain-containing protein [Chloroflexi bacterium]|nr:DUF429 domain-containing protein [Chloroflexota bacterium]
MSLLHDRNRAYGVDFSGARDAGKRIWIAVGRDEGKSLRIEACHRADTLPGSGRHRDTVLAALRDFIAKEPTSVFGLDFPFGLPKALVTQDSWARFVLDLPDHYQSADAFRHACREVAEGRELKRLTDAESQTPFSPYNLRLYRQTYHGIRDVLHPLVRDQQACVLPMQRASSGKPWILEICPASTLKQQGLYMFYKGKTDAHRMARARILESLEMAGHLVIATQAIRSLILDDHGGDALDSVIAAFATSRALRNPTLLTVERDEVYALEGRVYA